MTRDARVRMATPNHRQRALAALLAALGCLLALTLASEASAQDARRMALIIGNSEYDGAPGVDGARAPQAGMQADLANPVNDARAVADMLGGVYGSPAPRFNADFLTMNTALADFAVEVSRADADADQQGLPRPIVLIYFAGHGIEISGVNFLIPSNAQLPSADAMRDISGSVAKTRLAGRAIAVEDVADMFNNRGSGTTVIVVDACRNNPYGRSVRGASRGDRDGLADMASIAYGSVLIITSAEPTRTADDGRVGANSPFADAFVRFGARRDLSFLDAVTEMTSWVISHTPSQQRPVLFGSPTSRFCLLTCAEPAARDRERHALSRRGLNLIKEFEAFAPTPFTDPEGRCVVGYGHILSLQACATLDIDMTRQWDEVSAHNTLLQDAAAAADAVNDLVEVPLTQGQFDALVSFAFSVSPANFSRSSMLRIVNTGDHDTAARQFDRWIYSNAQLLPGLVTRRAREREMFVDGIIAAPQ